MSAQPQYEVDYLWVDPSYAQQGLNDAWPLLKEAVNKYSDGKYSKRGLLKKMKDNTAVLWLTVVNNEPVAALMTWVDQYEDQKRMTVPFAGGDMDALKGLYPHIESYAKADGCLAIEVWGRPGWARVGRDYGYEVIHHVVRKML